MIHCTQCAFAVRTGIDDCQLSKLRQILSKAFDQSVMRQKYIKQVHS